MRVGGIPVGQSVCRSAVSAISKITPLRFSASCKAETSNSPVNRKTLEGIYIYIYVRTIAVHDIRLRAEVEPNPLRGYSLLVLSVRQADVEVVPGGRALLSGKALPPRERHLPARDILFTHIHIIYRTQITIWISCVLIYRYSGRKDKDGFCINMEDEAVPLFPPRVVRGCQLFVVMTSLTCRRGFVFVPRKILITIYVRVDHLNTNLSM